MESDRMSVRHRGTDRALLFPQARMPAKAGEGLRRPANARECLRMPANARKERSNARKCARTRTLARAAATTRVRAHFGCRAPREPVPLPNLHPFSRRVSFLTASGASSSQGRSATEG
eukprot:6212736-Pleurochrysis_carterae.AAC.2